MKIIMVAKQPKWGSAIMRGNMTVDKLREMGHDASLVSATAFLADAARTNTSDGQRTLSDGSLPCVCVCVKFCDEKVIAACRARGAAVMWDMLDVELKHTRPAITQSVDLVVANSRTHAALLASPKHAARSVHIVYHHHSNVFGLSAEPAWPPSHAPMKLCFTASPTNMLEPSDEHEIKAAAEAAGFTFVNIPVGGKAAAFAPAPKVDASVVVDPYKQKRILLPLVTQCDAAIIWPRNRTDFFTVNYRPVTRLVTWWSLGIPTVVFPYAAYKDMMDMLPSTMPRLYASNVSEVRRALTWLANGAVAKDVEPWGSWPHTVTALKMAQATVASEFDLEGRMPSYVEALCTAWRVSRQCQEVR